MAAPVDVDTMGQPIDSLSREERREANRPSPNLADRRVAGRVPGRAGGPEEEIRREAEEHSLRRLFPGQRFSRALRRSAAR